jgi:hypothetical protein
MKELLKDYFSVNEFNDPNKWHGNTGKLKYTGYNLVEEINSLNPEKVLDLGCGYNIFKSKVQNLIGIDIANTKADYVMDFMEYPCEDNSVDVILNLGTINFGTFNTIVKQFGWVHSKLKQDGLVIIRANSSVPPSERLNNIFYKWDTETIVKLMQIYNFELINNQINIEFHGTAENLKHRMIFKFKKL